MICISRRRRHTEGEDGGGPGGAGGRHPKFSPDSSGEGWLFFAEVKPLLSKIRFTHFLFY